MILAASEEAVRTASSHLLGRMPDRLEPVRRGGNSRVFRVWAEDRSYAFKAYPTDGRDRLGQERKALDWLRDHGFSEVPAMVASDAERNCSLLEWLEGEPIDRPQARHVLALASFIARLDRATDAEARHVIGPATEACLCEADLLEQIERRIDAFLAADEPEIARLIAEGVRPRLARALAVGSPARALADGRCLSPSDFGTHNAVDQEGRVAFLDFEYFGWDDPVKRLSDALWHPGMALDLDLRRLLIRHLSANLGDEALARFQRHHPLYGIRWVLIVLKCFLTPDDGAATTRTRREQQLAKALGLLDRLAHADEEFKEIDLVQ